MKKIHQQALRAWRRGRDGDNYVFEGWKRLTSKGNK